MCAPSSTTFRGKVLRVGLAGIKPNVFKARNGRPDGVDVRILGLLQRKLKFRANVKIIRTLNGGFDVVWYAHVLKAQKNICQFKRTEKDLT